MPTLNDLMSKFASVDDAESPTLFSDDDSVVQDSSHTKIASEGEGMKSLTDIYMALNESDMHKTAAAVANVPQQYEDDDIDFAKLAADMADAEVEEYVQDDSGDLMKVAAEYDSAGRIMARGFYDEFMKLAGALDTEVTDNQMTESPSQASTPSLGERALPTVATNFAGNDAHDQKIETAGMEPKKVYADSLKPTKTISAGQGTGDNPEAAIASLSGG